MCISPLDGWLSRVRNESGKRSVVFDMNEGFADRPVTIPCGRCIECRLRKKRAWALRCEHEASLHSENCWFTLTYDNKNLPANGSLRKYDFQCFLKRLRAHEAWESSKHGVPERKFKFFACGEYGGRFNRAHYHCMLFGYAFGDSIPTTKRDGYQQYDSELLQKKWDKGITELGTASIEGYGYIAKYVTKRDKEREETLKALGMEPEFLVMSRGGRHGKGIGYDWWKQFGDELLEHDSCIMNHREVNVPSYYDKQNEICRPEAVAKIKAKRRQAIDEIEGRSTRLFARKKVLEGAENLFSGVVI